jgi:hypothetical protein
MLLRKRSKGLLKVKNRSDRVPTTTMNEPCTRLVGSSCSSWGSLVDEMTQCDAHL